MKILLIIQNYTHPQNHNNTKKKSHWDFVLNYKMSMYSTKTLNSLSIEVHFRTCEHVWGIIIIEHQWLIWSIPITSQKRLIVGERERAVFILLLPVRGFIYQDISEKSDIIHLSQ